MTLRMMEWGLAEGLLTSARPSVSSLLMVSETRLRALMISLSGASLRMTRGSVGGGTPAVLVCWRSSSEGTVSSGEGETSVDCKRDRVRPRSPGCNGAVDVLVVPWTNGARRS